MSSLSALVSPVADIDRRIHADPGNLLVILRNGSVVDAVDPGKRYKSGYRLAPWGHLQAFQVSLEPFVVEVEIVDVPLRAEPSGVRYHLPRVKVTLRARLKPTRRLLAGVVAEFGVNFATTIDDEVEGEVRGAVREYFRSLSHVDAWEAGHDGAFLSGATFFHGLLQVEAVLTIDLEPDPRFRESLDIHADTELAKSRIAAEADVSLSQVDSDKLLAEAEGHLESVKARAEVMALTAKVEAMAQLAATHHLNLAHLLDDKLAALEAQQRHEAIMAMLDNPVLLRKNTQLEKALLWHLDRISTPTVMDSPALNVQGGEAAMSLGAAVVRGEVVPSYRPMDARLLDVWRSSGRSDDALLALGSARVDDSAHLLAITSGAEGSETEFEDPAALGCRSVRLTVVPTQPTLRSLVLEYFRLCVPEMVDSTGEWMTSVEGNRLVIGVTDGLTRASEARRAIRSTHTLLLEPLQNVLPYEGIDVIAKAE